MEAIATALATIQATPQLQAQYVDRDVAGDSPSRETREHWWSIFADRLRDRDEETAEKLKGEIDSLLTFAGLFSIVLAIVNFGLYIVYQPYSPDANAQALLKLLSITSNSSLESNIVVASDPAITPPAAPVLVLTLTTSSLIILLSSTSISMIVRQWLDFFVSPHPGKGQRSAYTHCLRWDKGLLVWHVPTLINTLFILQQVAMALFLGAFIIFLWTINVTVAVVATTLASSTAIFWVITTVAPAFDPLCPYKSPQALVILQIIQYALRINTLRAMILKLVQQWSAKPSAVILWPSTDDSQKKRQRLRQASRSWVTLEQYVMDDERFKTTLNWVEENVFAVGYELLLDDDLLCHVVPPCVQKPIQEPPPNISRVQEGHIKRIVQEMMDDSQRKANISRLVSLRRLQRLAVCSEPLSQTMRSAIAESAGDILSAESLPLADLMVQDLRALYEFIPRICAAGQEHMAAALHYLASQPSSLSSDTEFVKFMLQSTDFQRIISQGPLSLDDPKDCNYVKRIVHVLCMPIGDNPISTAHIDRPYIYNASCLGILLLRSIPQHEIPLTILKHLIDQMQIGYINLLTDNSDTHNFMFASLIQGYELLRSASSIQESGPPRPFQWRSIVGDEDRSTASSKRYRAA